MVEGCLDGGLGHLLQYMRKYNAERLKQGRKRLNSIVKTIHFSYLPIIYLRYTIPISPFSPLPSCISIIYINNVTLNYLQKYYHPVSFICACSMSQSKKGLQEGLHFIEDAVLCQSISPYYVWR